MVSMTLELVDDHDHDPLSMKQRQTPKIYDSHPKGKIKPLSSLGFSYFLSKGTR